jgi:hypothetical protein
MNEILIKVSLRISLGIRQCNLKRKKIVIIIIEKCQSVKLNYFFESIYTLGLVIGQAKKRV